MDIKSKEEKLKRCIIAISLIIVCIILSYIVIRVNAIKPKYVNGVNEVEVLNENINTMIKFGEPLNREIFESSEWEILEYDYEIFYINKHNDSYGFYGFPDLSNELKFTYYKTNNPQFVVFGFQVGDDFKEFEKTLKNNGYLQEDRTSDFVHFRNGKVRIWIDIKMVINEIDGVNTQTEIIEYFNVHLESTDWLFKGYYK